MRGKGAVAAMAKLAAAGGALTLVGVGKVAGLAIGFLIAALVVVTLAGVVGVLSQWRRAERASTPFLQRPLDASRSVPTWAHGRAGR